MRDVVQDRDKSLAYPKTAREKTPALDPGFNRILSPTTTDKS